MLVKDFDQSEQSKHQKRADTGNKRYACKYCKKDFKYKHKLVSHENVHTREKPFSCKFCEKKFHRNDHCKQHENIHTGESCEINCLCMPIIYLHNLLYLEKIIYYCHDLLIYVYKICINNREYFDGNGISLKKMSLV